MSESEVLRLETLRQAATPATPMAMLAMAVEQGADLDKLEKLMALQERWEANEARKAFVSAMAEFKANPPEIHKNKQVSFTTQKGTTNYKHATLDEVAIQIGQALAPHGLSFRWNVEQGPKIRVTCILQHRMGHTEQVQMEGSQDDSGTKNNIQAVGSTVTYLERYTLLAITGMAVKDQDNDGRALSPELMKELDAIREAKTIQSLQEVANAAFKRAGAARRPAEQGEIIRAKDARKAELQGVEK